MSRIVRAGTKVGYSDQLDGNGKASNQKGSYDRDNRVISPKSPYRRRSLPPQTRGVFLVREIMNWLYAGTSGESDVALGIKKQYVGADNQQGSFLERNSPSTTTRQQLKQVDDIV